MSHYVTGREPDSSVSSLFMTETRASCVWCSDSLAVCHGIGKKKYFPILILRPRALSTNSLSLPQDSDLEIKVKGPHRIDYAGETTHGQQEPTSGVKGRRNEQVVNQTPG